MPLLGSQRIQNASQTLGHFISHIQFVPFDYKETLLYPPCQSIATPCWEYFVWWVMLPEQTCKEEAQARPHREVQWAEWRCGSEQSYQEGGLGTWTTWLLWAKLRPGLRVQQNRKWIQWWKKKKRVTCLTMILHQEGSLLPSEAWYLVSPGEHAPGCV